MHERLETVPEGATVITNRDDLLAEYAAELCRRGATHVTTTQLAPEALLAAMARFADIRSNDSTIAFWAALLGGGGVTLTLPRLVELMATLRPAAG
ncbi:MAG: hypothetical protein SNJ79_04100 [Sphingomonadaceae bacterium]